MSIGRVLAALGGAASGASRGLQLQEELRQRKRQLELQEERNRIDDERWTAQAAIQRQNADSLAELRRLQGDTQRATAKLKTMQADATPTRTANETRRVATGERNARTNEKRVGVAARSAAAAATSANARMMDAQTRRDRPPQPRGKKSATAGDPWQRLVERKVRSGVPRAEAEEIVRQMRAAQGGR